MQVVSFSLSNPMRPLRPGPPASQDHRGEDLDEELDHLYERYSGLVDRWVRRLGGPGADVEDLTHDIFVVALRRRAEFRGDASPATWLFRITDRVVAGRRRRSLVRRWLFARSAHELAERPEQPTALDQLERRERHLRLYAALDRIPHAYRTALILYEIEGLSGQQVADLVGIDVKAVWVRLHRARAKLLVALGGRTKP